MFFHSSFCLDLNVNMILYVILHSCLHSEQKDTIWLGHHWIFTRIFLCRLHLLYFYQSVHSNRDIWPLSPSIFNNCSPFKIHQTANSFISVEISINDVQHVQKDGIRLYEKRTAATATIEKATVANLR